MVNTRAAATRPNPAERVENANLRKRVKASYEKTQQEEAFKELLTIIGANGGKVPYGAMDKLVKKFNSNGFKAVNRQNLYYRLEKLKSNKSNDSLVGKTLSVSEDNTAIVSDLSGETLHTVTDNTTSNDTSIINIAKSNAGGRKKGSTVAAKAAKETTREDTVTRCAILYNAEREKAIKAGLKVPDGTLKRIINEEEIKAGLESNNISLDTIRSRVKRGNLEAFNPTEVSPVACLEPILCDICIRLGKMGRPLTKTTVIELANYLIGKTELQENVAAAKKLRHLEQETTLGTAWYRGFLNRHAAQLTTSGTVIKDVKRRTWVTQENFENMYENVYKTMVEAGVAEELEEAIQLDAGLPTKYKLTVPDHVLFVDETGSNTNQLNDGRVGGERFILPKDNSECGAPTGATTDIHYTVLPFISGTGEAVLCAIIFKSELDISEIPIS